MSSTWYRSVRAIKTDLHQRYSTGYSYTKVGYILIADTAESNVTNDRGGHPYHESIMAYGEFDEVYNQVCSCAYHFETGMAKWKPNGKDAAGFLRVCKKAINSAKYADEIPACIDGIVYWDFGNERDLFFGLLPENDVIKHKVKYGDRCIVTQHAPTYIRAKLLIKSIWEDFRNSALAASKGVDLDKWFEENRGDYSDRLIRINEEMEEFKSGKTN